MPTPVPVCTRVCTGEGENTNADALDTRKQDKSEGDAAAAPSPLVAAFAAVLTKLSPEDRQRLAALLH
jgi:hypothetical protein